MLSYVLYAATLAHLVHNAGGHPLNAPPYGNPSTGPDELGPVITSNFPDPSLMKVNDTWYAFATNSEGINVPMATSADFITWTVIEGADALPSLPGWVNATSPAVWAPDVNQLDDGTFVMYFSATPLSDYEKHCVGAATSASITGPYMPLPDPLLCPLAQGGAIDASGFKDWQQRGTGWGDSSTNTSADAPDNSWTQPEWWGGGAGGQRYVVYKVDGNAIGNGNLPGQGNCGNTIEPIVSTPLVLQPVAADGVTLEGEAVTLLDNNGLADQGVVEAPSLVKKWKGGYVLFFSSGCYSTGNYTVSYATAGNVTGPYVRRGTLFQTGVEGLYAPGGPDIYWDAQHMLFHADYPYQNASSRAMYTAVVEIQGDTVVA